MNKSHLILATAAFLTFAALCATAQHTVWTGSWAAAPVVAPATEKPIGPDGETFRNIVHLSLGGRAVRLRISNEFGPTPLTVISRSNSRFSSRSRKPNSAI